MDASKRPSSPKTYFIKCIMLGHASVGKTCLANRVASGKFLDCPITTFTADSVIKRVNLPSGDIVNIDLWDTAGQERYRSLTLSYFRNSKAALVVYDAWNKGKIKDWLKEIQIHVGDGQILVFLIGTKLDLGSEGLLTDDEVKALSGFVNNRLDIAGHFALSSKTGSNVEETFQAIAEIALQANLEKRLKLAEESEVVKVRTERSRMRKCCSF